MVDSWWHETIYLYADLSRGKLSSPALSRAIECLDITYQHPEQIFICLDHLLRDRLKEALVWIARVEQREALASIARGFYQLMEPGEDTTAILQNLRKSLFLLRPLQEHSCDLNRFMAIFVWISFKRQTP